MTKKESLIRKVSATGGRSCHCRQSEARNGRQEVIKAGIIGGAGYTGGELIRLLLNHPNSELTFINSRSNAGKFIYEIHQDLIGETDLKFTDDSSFLENGGIDVLFLCLGHGESKKFIAENKIGRKNKNN